MILILNASILSKPVIRIIPVGSATDSGSYCFGTSGVELRGAGKGLYEKNDGFLFAYSITSGNCDLQTSYDFTDTSNTSETGLMFRTDTSDSAPFCALLVSKDKVHISNTGLLPDRISKLCYFQISSTQIYV